MFMILPDGTKFRLLNPDKIPLNLAIRAQKVTGIGPVALATGLSSNRVKLVALTPIYERVQAAGDDEVALRAALGELQAAIEDGDIDLMVQGIHIWLSRLAAGHRNGDGSELSMEQACDFSLLDAKTELEPDEQAELDRREAEAEQVPPTTAAASSNGRASGKRAPRPRATSTSK